MPMNYNEMEQAISNLREGVTVYEEILKETRRSEERAKQSENRLLSTVHWTLATAISVTLIAAGAVIGLNWWINEKVYTRDKQALREELTIMMKEEIKTLGRNETTRIRGEFTELEKNLVSDQKERLKPFREEINTDIRESFAYTLGQVADIRLFLRDVEGAVRTGLEQFDQATQGPIQYQAHALDKLITAFTIGTQDKKRIPDEWLAQVQKKLLERSDAKSDPKLSQLGQTIEAYRDALRP